MAAPKTSTPQNLGNKLGDTTGLEKWHWKKGQSGNAGGMSKACREVRDLCKTLVKPALARLAEISVGEDPHAAIAATKVILVRAIGKERELEGLQGKTTPREGVAGLDLKTLSDGQLDRIHKILLENAP